MAISASTVKELRERTGAGMMDCKKALTATDGDMQKAIDWLREKGIAKAAKKSGRTAADGAVAAYISKDGKTGVLLEVNCETDFTANNQNHLVWLSWIALRNIFLFSFLFIALSSVKTLFWNIISTGTQPLFRVLWCIPAAISAEGLNTWLLSH